MPVAKNVGRPKSRGARNQPLDGMTEIRRQRKSATSNQCLVRSIYTYRGGTGRAEPPFNLRLAGSRTMRTRMGNGASWHIIIYLVRHTPSRYCCAGMRDMIKFFHASTAGIQVQVCNIYNKKNDCTVQSSHDINSGGIRGPPVDCCGPPRQTWYCYLLLISSVWHKYMSYCSSGPLVRNSNLGLALIPYRASQFQYNFL